MPWLDTSKIMSTRYRPIYKWFFALFILDVIALGYLGAQPAEGVYLFYARITAVYYFLHLLVILPVLGWIEKPSAMPGSITDDVLGKKPVAAE